MAYVDRYDAAFGVYVSRYLRNNMHTNIRGRVVSVNLGVPSVDIQPMASTEFESGTVDRYPTIYDVPLHLPSGNGGKARLSMPVKTGDIVGLSFSERNEDSTSDLTTHQLFPGWAVTQIFTGSNAKPIDPENVVLENDKGKITLSPQGDIKLEGPSLKLDLSPDGTLNVDNGPGKLSLSPSGELTCNGAKITPDGRIRTAQGVDMDDFYNWAITHNHGGVETGDGRTQGPNSPVRR